MKQVYAQNLENGGTDRSSSLSIYLCVKELDRKNACPTDRSSGLSILFGVREMLSHLWEGLTYMRNNNAMELTVRPVAAENLNDFVALFESRGAPHFCWCTLYRMPDQRLLSNAEKKEAMCNMLHEGIPVGVLAYDGERPIGWCSVAPRETYKRLDRSRTMPRVTPADLPTWTILCFFVLRTYRSKGVAKRLLEGAVAYARAQGAQVIEA
ncbi:GNAT family N-acetyltransferase [Rubrobacter xylanophilus]|nr:GNAT family N-acetyltransferase [Rubrobacter xylanophilus]